MITASIVSMVAAFGGPGEESVPTLRSSSRSPYVHRLTLYDHDGEAISPDEEPARPYSPRATCGKCHEVAAVRHGWHFNADRPDVPPGRPGEPWILTDPQSGTVVPMSTRLWPGARSPAELGLSEWRFVLRFGGHSPGGGLGDPSPKTMPAAIESSRWLVSGPLEIDCMFCHSADAQHDPAEAARQIERQNFKWSPTAALGLAVIRGDAGKVPDDWDPLMPPHPDYPEQAGPQVIYDGTRFDGDNRVFFNITRRPSPERCYFCHTVREVGEGAPNTWQVGGDVHLAAGMVCTDCHRNDINHKIVRGYDEEARERGDPSVAVYSCAGCHLGTDEEAEGETLGGRYGAPRPLHRGMPTLHFEVLTCTACHSGPWPEMVPRRVQTSMAHGLGLASKERKDDDLPTILEPIFARQSHGEIAPHRMMWPMESGQHVGAEPYLWPLGHDVRPAAQSLGVRGCADCHARDAPFYFGRTDQVGQGDDPRAKTMVEFQQADPQLVRAWLAAIGTRPVLQLGGWYCAALIAAILIRYGLLGLAELLRRLDRPSEERQ